MRWKIVRVEGNSMLPTLRSGQLLLVDSRRTPAVGDVVTALDPRNGAPIVKRLTGIEATGYWLEGDGMHPSSAATSTDSWVYGPVQSLTGVVVWPLLSR